MLRTRILAAATATFLALGMAAGGASPALADHRGSTTYVPPVIAGVEVINDNGLTCDGAGYQKPEGPDGTDRASGDYSAEWGEISWDGSSITWSFSEGYDVDLCVKGSVFVSKIDTSGYAGSTYDFADHTGHGISHVGFIVRSAPIEVVPGAETTPENCLDGDGTITFSANLGVTYTVGGVEYGPGEMISGLAAGDYDVTAVADTGYVLDGAAAFTVTVGSTSEDCPVEPIEVVPGAESTPENCLDGEGTITFSPDLGVTYTVDGVDYGPGDTITGLAAGEYDVTAEADTGYVLDGPASFTVTVDATEVDCPVEPIEVVPGAESTPTNCVDGEGSIEFSDAEGVTYTVAGIDGTFEPGDLIDNLDAGDYEITATADGGYVLDGDSVFTVEVEFEFVDCLPTEGTASVDLTYLPSSCVSDGVVMVDAEGTSNVKSTSISRDGVVVTLVFVANDDSQFNTSEPIDLTGEGDAPSLEATYSEDLRTLTVVLTFDEFTEQECADTVVVPVPSVIDTCLEQSYTITAVKGASYAVSVNGGLPMPVSFEEGEDSVTISADPFDEIVVTATADEGYVLAEGYKPFEYAFEFDEDCLPTAPVTTASVTFTQADCLGNPGSYTLTNEPGVIWTVDGVVVEGNTKYTAAVGSTPTIVASLEPASEEFPTGFGWSDPEQRTLWNLVFEAADDCLPTLAFTGASNALGGLGVIAILIMMAGTGLVVARRREAVRIQG